MQMSRRMFLNNKATRTSPVALRLGMTGGGSAVFEKSRFCR